MVKEKRYFAATMTRRAGQPCRGSGSRDGGVAPKQKVPGIPRPESTLLEGSPAITLAGGEDNGYFASGAGNAGSNPAAVLRDCVVQGLRTPQYAVVADSPANNFI